MNTETTLIQEIRKLEKKESFKSSRQQLNPCSECQNLTLQEHLEGFCGLCDSCYGKRRLSENLGFEDGRKEKQSLETRAQRWEELCPELYRKSNTSFIDGHKFASVTRWKIGSQGLILSGQSRSGKTTSCWHLLHKLYVLEGRSFMALSEPEFTIIREKNARRDGLDGFLAKCIFSDIFFLDDIGHSASTSKHMEELYYIIEKRTSWKRPILATTNFSFDEMEERAGKYGSAKTAKAILNRLKCFCYTIEF